jgi:hypothetical protein
MNAAVAQFETRGLQLERFATDDRPVLAPVELERFACLENQRYERAATGRLLLLLLMLPSCLREGRNTAISAVKPSTTK